MTDHLGPFVPGIAFRIGITGTRTLTEDPTRLARLTHQMRQLLVLVKAQAQALVGVFDSYTPCPPLLRIVSPLAEGADRLVARLALELGYQLEVLLPFAQAEYERDFTSEESLADFRALLDRAEGRVLALDGGRGDDAAGSYSAVGRMVVRNCDLVLALWDGHPGKGVGGTADTVRFAARSGPPVWWVDAEGLQEPAWVETMTALRRPRTLPRCAEAAARLEAYVQGIITPPPLVAAVAEGVLGRPFRRYGVEIRSFLDERLPLGGIMTDWLWGIERRVMNAAGLAGQWLDQRLPGHHAVTVPLPTPPPPCLPTSPLPGDPVASYWDRIYATPDKLAVEYANRYRSSFVLVAMLAAFAVLFGNAAVLWPNVKLELTAAEFGALVLLICLVALNQQRHWHERWISYRLLAELCRKQRILGMLGWSLPLGETWRSVAGGQGHTEGRIDAKAEPGSWVSWYFHAVLRASPLPRGILAGTALEATRARISWELLDNQIGYHEMAAERARWRSRGLAGWGEIFMLLTAALVLIKWLLLQWESDATHGIAAVLGLGSTLLAVPSAAFIALRAYAELEVLERDNSTMAAMMVAAKLRLTALAPPLEEVPLPLVSQEVAAVVYDVAIDMLDETEGWARLFKVKSVEAA